MIWLIFDRVTFLIIKKPVMILSIKFYAVNLCVLMLFFSLLGLYMPKYKTADQEKAIKAIRKGQPVRTAAQECCSR